MDDAKIGHDIRERAYELMSGKRGLVPSDADLGRAAREVMAKPEATREAVKKWWDNEYNDSLSQASLDKLCAAISHFAPPARPKTMIEGMSVEDIAAEFRNSWHSPDRPATDQWYSQHVARVAHRLANTPVPEHDPDLELGREILKAANAKLPEGRPRLTYTDDYARAVGRAVAAAKKEAGGE